MEQGLITKEAENARKVKHLKEEAGARQKGLEERIRAKRQQLRAKVEVVEGREAEMRRESAILAEKREKLR